LLNPHTSILSYNHFQRTTTQTAPNKLSEYSQTSVLTIPDIRFESQFSNGWTKLAFADQHNRQLAFPKKFLFLDFAYKHPLPVLNLRNWSVCKGVFEVIGRECPDARELVLDHCIGLSEECFGLIRGHKQLRKLSLAGIVDCPITPMIAEVLGSFGHLVSLNLSDCEVRPSFRSLRPTLCSDFAVVVQRLRNDYSVTA
jgi:hypothetical protein